MLMGKGKGILQIPPQKAVDDFARDLHEKFIKNGIPNEAVNNVNDVKVIWNQITNREAQILSTNLKDVLKKPDPFKKAGEVVDLTGKKIDTSKPILGGKNVPESEAQIKTKLEGINKKTVDRIRRRRYEAALKEERRKMAEDPDYIQNILDPEDFAQGGRTGFKEGLGVYDDGEEDDAHGLVGSVGKLSKLSQLLSYARTGAKYGPLGILGQYAVGKFGSKYVRPVIERALFKKPPGPHSSSGPISNINVQKMKVGMPENITLGGGQNNQGSGGGGPDRGRSRGKGETGQIAGGHHFAQGGRTGSGLNYLLGEDDQNVRVPFKDGTKFNPKRRGFLKLAAGLASIPFIGKFFKWAKPLAKTVDLTSVPIGSAEGMPSWFKPLVNKVIKEGKDISYGESVAERVIVHQSKLPGSKTPIHVTQDLNTGDVVVDIGVGKHGWSAGHHGQPSRLVYKAEEQIEPILPSHMDPKNPTGHWKPHKAQKTKEEFWVEEAEFTGGHPENVKFEESSFNKFGEHGSDFTEVEKFATGKVKKAKPTKKRKATQWNEGSAQAEADAAAERGHWIDDRAPDADDFASGGRVPFFKGKIAKGILSLGKKKKKKLTADDVSQDHPLRRKEFEEELFGTKEQQESKKFKEKIIKKLEQYHKLKYMDTKGKKGHAFGGRVPLSGGGGSTRHSPSHWNSIIEAWDAYEGPMGFPEFYHHHINKADGGRVPLGGGKKVPDPGYFMFQEPSEDRPSRYEYDLSNPEVMEEMKRVKEELIEQGIIEQETFSETDMMPIDNYFLDAMQNPKDYFPTEYTPEELENFKRNLRLKQQVKDGGRVPLAGGKLAKYATPEGLAKLIEKLFPGTTKLGQTSRPMAPKTELKQAIAGFQEREKAAKLKIWENPDKVRAAVDDIFSSGDYKMDAEMASEALVENNPAAFGGKLIDDIDDATRSEIYGAVLRVVQSDLAKTLQLKRLSRPKKTLEGIEKTGTINISDEGVADEFTRFMKETDPKGHKKIEEIVELSNFDPKGKKGHAEGGRVPMFMGGGLKAGKSFLRELLKNLAKDKNMTGSKIMKVMNPKAYKKFVEDAAIVRKWDPESGLLAIDKAKQLMKTTKEKRADQLEYYLDMAKSSKEADKNIQALIDAGIKSGMRKELAEKLAKNLRDVVDAESIIPRGVTDETILDLEQMFKNLKTKDRKLNASGGRVSLSAGGLAGMLGE